MGQLAVIAWQLNLRAAQHAEEVRGNDLDLRRLTGTELNRHLAQVGA